MKKTNDILKQQKNRKGKIFRGSKIVALFIFIFCVPLCVARASEKSGKEYDYNIKDDGTIILKSYEGNQKNIIIPENIDGMLVSELDGTFFGTDVTTVKIPETIDMIAPGTFNNFCMQKIDVDINNQNFCSVEGVLFDKDIKTLCAYPCANGNSAYNVPEGVEIIEMFAFDWAEELTNILLPDSLKIVQEDAFRFTGINEIKFPENVEKIGAGCVAGCENLEKIDIACENRNYIEIEGVLFDKNMGTLVAYPKGKKNEEYIVPDGVKRIEEAAFFGCDNLKEIILPETLEVLGPQAFCRCTRLTEIQIPYNVKQLPESVFASCSSLKNIYLPYGVEEIEDYSLYCENVKEITLPETVAFISDYAFYDNVELMVRENSYAYTWVKDHGMKYRCIE